MLVVYLFSFLLLTVSKEAYAQGTPVSAEVSTPPAPATNDVTTPSASGVGLPVEIAVPDELGYSSSPTWCDKPELLFFAVPIQFASYEPSTNKTRSVFLDNTDISFFVSGKKKDTFFAAISNHEIGKLKWDGKSKKMSSSTPIAELGVDEQTSGLYSGVVDESGRLIIGDRGLESFRDTYNSTIFVIDKKNHNKPKILLTNLQDAMVGAFTSDSKKIYLKDERGPKVSLYDYDKHSGTVSNRQKGFDFSHIKELELGEPSAMVRDQDGNFWMTIEGAGHVIQVDSSGIIMKFIQLPSLYPTGLAWAGKDKNVLYVTTRYNYKYSQDPFDGSVYVIKNTGTKGSPLNKADL